MKQLDYSRIGKSWENQGGIGRERKRGGEQDKWNWKDHQKEGEYNK